MILQVTPEDFHRESKHVEFEDDFLCKKGSPYISGWNMLTVNGVFQPTWATATLNPWHEIGWRNRDRFSFRDPDFRGLWDNPDIELSRKCHPFIYSKELVNVHVVLRGREDTCEQKKIGWFIGDLIMVYYYHCQKKIWVVCHDLKTPNQQRFLFIPNMISKHLVILTNLLSSFTSPDLSRTMTYTLRVDGLCSKKQPPGRELETFFFWGVIP